MSAGLPPARSKPASPGQRLLWIMDRYRGGNGMMGVPLLYRMRGRLDEHALVQAIAGLVRRHEALRTTFGMQRRTLHQFIHAPTTIVVPHKVIDLNGVPNAGQVMTTQVQAFLRADPDYASCPLVTALWRLNSSDQMLVLNIHHLVTDAWSNMVISRDLAALYSAAVRRTASGLPPVVWQQTDYVAWQQQRLRGEVLLEHQAYWQEHLRDATFPQLPDNRSADGQRAEARPGVFMANEWFALPPDLLARLRAVGRARRCTLFSVLLAAMLVALRELTSQEDLSIGSIFANRSRPEVRQTVGFLANMVVVRARVPRAADGDLIFDRVGRSVIGALAHEELPFLSIPFGTVRGAAEPRTRGRPEDVVFHMLAVPPDAGLDAIRFTGLEVVPLRIPDGLGSRFDLEVLIIPSQHGLDGVIRYTPDRFDTTYIHQFAELYLATAESFASSYMAATHT